MGQFYSKKWVKFTWQSTVKVKLNIVLYLLLIKKLSKQANELENEWGEIKVYEATKADIWQPIVLHFHDAIKTLSCDNNGFSVDL